MISKPAQVLLLAAAVASASTAVTDCSHVRKTEDMGGYRGWWTPNGVTTKWKALPVSWSYTCENDGGQPEFREAARWWNKRMDAGIFVEAPCGLGKESITGVEDFPLEVTLGATWVGADRDGQILMATTRVSSLYRFASPACRMTVTRHELGHALGLAHSRSAECLMYASSEVDAGEPKDLCPSEEALVRRVYGLEPDAGSM